MAKEAVCGERCSDWCASADPSGCSLRMWARSALEALTGYSLTWKRKATPAGRSWWVLGRSGRPTSGSASGSWPTATRQDAAQSGAAAYSTESGRHAGTTLTDAARGLWASPQARDWKDSGPTQGNRKSPNLGTQAHWPSPQARDGDNRGADPSRVGDPKRHGGWNLDDWVARAGLLDRGSHSTSGRSRDSWPTPDANSHDRGGQPDLAWQKARGRTETINDVVLNQERVRGVLNSRWVAQLMGYPSDWCDVPTEKLSALTATRSSRKSSR